MIKPPYSLYRDIFLSPYTPQGKSNQYFFANVLERLVFRNPSRDTLTFGDSVTYQRVLCKCLISGVYDM